MGVFDVVLPVGPDEIPIINEVVDLVKTNVIGYNRIFLVTNDETLVVDGCTTINENIFPFTKKNISDIIGESSRISWVYQQLLKLYSVNTIPDCLENILILDADVFILTQLNFMEDGKPIFTVGYEKTLEYHEHSKRLHPSLIRVYENFSGVSHHMLFNRKYMYEIFKLIENFHGDSFFNVFIKSIDNTNLNDLKCSEYEIYFNYMCLNYPENIIIRELKWGNVGTINDSIKSTYNYASIPKYYGTR